MIAARCPARRAVGVGRCILRLQELGFRKRQVSDRAEAIAMGSQGKIEGSAAASRVCDAE
jgi:hypothetical protein